MKFKALSWKLKNPLKASQTLEKLVENNQDLFTKIHKQSEDDSKTQSEALTNTELAICDETQNNYILNILTFEKTYLMSVAKWK